MATKERARELFQSVYYDSVDRGDMATAVTAFHEDVDWSHAQVWAHHEFARQAPTQLRGRAAVEAFLSARTAQLAEAKIRHSVRDMVFEDDRGAFLGVVTGEDGRELPFMVWFEIRDDRIGRYVLRPL